MVRRDLILVQRMLRQSIYVQFMVILVDASVAILSYSSLLCLSACRNWGFLWIDSSPLIPL